MFEVYIIEHTVEDLYFEVFDSGTSTSVEEHVIELISAAKVLIIPEEVFHSDVYIICFAFKYEKKLLFLSFAYKPSIGITRFSGAFF